MRFSRYILFFAFLILAYCAVCQDADKEVEVFRFEEEEEQNPVKELWEKGEIAVREHMHDSAIKYFEEFLKQKDKTEPDYNEKYLKATEYIVKSHLLMKNANAAVAKLTETKDGTPVHTLSKDLTYCLAQAYVLRGEWEDATAALMKLISKETPEPLRLNSAILAADCMMKLGQWQRLADHIEKYFADNGEPQNFDLLYRLSQAYIALGENVKADASIGKLSKTRMDADNALKYNILFVRNLSILGNAKPALETFEKISNQMPDSPDNDWWLMLTALSDALYNANMLDDAFKKYELVLKMASDNEQKLHALQYQFLISIKQSRKKDELIRRVDEFQKNYPSSVELIEMVDILARHLQKKGENNTAAEQFIRLTTLIPDAQTMYQAFFNAGECFAAFGNFENAISAFLSAHSKGLTDNEKAAALFRAAEIARYLCKSANAVSKDAAPRAIGYFKDVADKYAASPQAPGARFAQAELLEQTGQFKEAADVFGSFGESYPKDAHFEESICRRGICMRLGAKDTAEKLAAAKFLSESAKTLSQALSNDAHIEAFHAFKEANALKEAEAELTFVVDSKAERDKRLEALFRRAMLRYETGDIANARADTDTLREDFPGNKYTDELCIFTGDSYANQQDWKNALKYYSEPTGEKHDENIRPYALFEAANANYRLGDYTHANEKAEELVAFFQDANSMSPSQRQLLARTFYLMGDIMVSSTQPDFAKAQECYGKCSEFAEDKDLKFASIGRRGDVFLQIASQNQRKLQNNDNEKNYFSEAIKYYGEIVRNYPIEHPLGLMARYKKAKALKSAKDYDNALKEYKDFYASFEQRSGKHSTMDTFYFASAVYEMAEILESKGDEDSLNDAKRFYSRLASTNHPSAGTARERVKVIRDKLDELKRKRHK